ncbi:Lin0512 family protein [Nioella sp.]|jgi:uncharacterized protein (TIGR02058 family)|uniref:Lin0512 family protein n=1 Tax=Nioella sp. TaxID=1912091 RepID=UPI003A886B05
MKPLICELGMGADVHGHDYTKAALRGVSDAIRHSSLTIFYSYKHPSEMRVEVMVGVPEPDKVDTKAIADALPFGEIEVIVVKGGLNDKGMGGAEDITLASVAVKAWLDTTGHGFQLAATRA